MNETEPLMQCHCEGRKQYQWQILPPPMVSSNMSSNLLIIGYFVRNFFFLSYLFTSSLLIIICGKYHIVERFMGQILIWVAGHASVLISKWRCVLCGHCFMWSQGSASQMTVYLKPRRKGNLGGVEELKQGKMPERKVVVTNSEATAHKFNQFQKRLVEMRNLGLICKNLIRQADPPNNGASLSVSLAKAHMLQSQILFWKPEPSTPFLCIPG